ncbi:MAG: hypothetical protein WC732_09665 [Candidatus Omnitrophota bacterium]
MYVTATIFGIQATLYLSAAILLAMIGKWLIVRVQRGHVCVVRTVTGGVRCIEGPAWVVHVPIVRPVRKLCVSLSPFDVPVRRRVFALNGIAAGMHAGSAGSPALLVEAVVSIDPARIVCDADVVALEKIHGTVHDRLLNARAELPGFLTVKPTHGERVEATALGLPPCVVCSERLAARAKAYAAAWRGMNRETRALAAEFAKIEASRTGH